MPQLLHPQDLVGQVQPGRCGGPIPRTMPASFPRGKEPCVCVCVHGSPSSTGWRLFNCFQGRFKQLKSLDGQGILRVLIRMKLNSELAIALACFIWNRGTQYPPSEGTRTCTIGSPKLVYPPVKLHLGCGGQVKWRHCSATFLLFAIRRPGALPPFPLLPFTSPSTTSIVIYS